MENVFIFGEKFIKFRMTALKNFIHGIAQEDVNNQHMFQKNLELKKEVVSFLIKNTKATISDISQHVKISIPKINETINKLIEDGLVIDLGKELVGVGRKPNFYGLNPDAGYFLAVETHRHYLNIAVLDFAETIIHSEEHISFKLENNSTSYEAFCKNISDYMDGLPFDKGNIIGLGVNITGRVNPKTGSSYSFFNMFETTFEEMLADKFKIPVYIDNDSRAMAFGEYAKGCVTTEKNTLFINLNDGIGMGIIINGTLYSGKSGYAGEFGHLPILDNDIICHCGKKGCLETEASGMALLDQLKDAINNGTSSILSEKINDHSLRVNHLIEAALKDDTLSIELISKAGEKIGKGIALLLNLFNPELIVLGGELSKAETLILLPILSSINKHSLSLINNDTKFLFSKLQNKAGLIGISLLLRNKILELQ